MNLCPALMWTDLCDSMVLTHRVGLNLSLVVLFSEICQSILSGNGFPCPDDSVLWDNSD